MAGFWNAAGNATSAADPRLAEIVTAIRRLRQSRRAGPKTAGNVGEQGVFAPGVFGAPTAIPQSGTGAGPFGPVY